MPGAVKITLTVGDKEWQPPRQKPVFAQPDLHGAGGSELPGQGGVQVPCGGSRLHRTGASGDGISPQGPPWRLPTTTILRKTYFPTKNAGTIFLRQNSRDGL